MSARQCLILFAALMLAGPSLADTATPAAPPPPGDRASAVAAIGNVLTLDRPGEDGLATVWDGNKYVQCRHMTDRSLRCEAGGALMQPSLSRVLLSARVAKLNELGWILDPSFGNYVRTFPLDAPAERVADAVLAALQEGYGADLNQVEVGTTWIPTEPCPPRNGPRQNLAGVIDEAPSMKATAVHACSYTPAPGVTPEPVAHSVQDLVDTYGGRVTGEIGRLRVNRERQVYAVFDAAVGYVQCQPDTASGSLYCEAASPESWPVLASVLTPERLARLHAAGFTDPGRSQNYERSFAFSTNDDASIARQILAALYEVYGYDGARKLKFLTD